MNPAAEPDLTARSLTLTKGAGGLPMIQVTTPWSNAQVYLHGAHVAHFQEHGQQPLLFLSQKSRFMAGHPIRGGVPVVLPWFGPREGRPAHGIARLKSWQIKHLHVADDASAHIHLRLLEDAESGTNPFVADYFITVGKSLVLELRMANKSADRDLTFEECLHAYFAVGDIAQTEIVGLKGTKYLDKVDQGLEKLETADAIRIASEVDRVYLDTRTAVEIRDGKLGRIIRIEKTGSADTVVWNPWIEKSRRMEDFGDEEYPGMVCVEPGNIGPSRITLAPGQSSLMTVTISSRASG